MIGLQFISHYTDSITYEDSVRIALEGGCRWIQLRMKGVDDACFLETALRVSAMCRNYNAVFIIDDRVHLVGECGADGVHLGLSDMPVSEARAILGPDRIIGGTANTLEHVAMHAESGANYIGCGPFRFTSTKDNLSPVLGLDGYRNIVAGMKRLGINIPIVAIGGITMEDIPLLMQTGISGIALSGSILRSDDPVQEMIKVRNSLNASGIRQVNNKH